MSDLASFHGAGRTLFSLGLVRGTEGNLSTFDGETLVITRTGADLRSLGPEDLVRGGLVGEVPGASSDLAVHRERYRSAGPGSIVHAHPPGSVPEGGPEPGRHGVYVHAGSLPEAVHEAVRMARVDHAVPR